MYNLTYFPFLWIQSNRSYSAKIHYYPANSFISYQITSNLRTFSIFYKTHRYAGKVFHFNFKQKICRYLHTFFMFSIFKSFFNLRKFLISLGKLLSFTMCFHYLKKSSMKNMLWYKFFLSACAWRIAAHCRFIQLFPVLKTRR